MRDYYVIYYGLTGLALLISLSAQAYIRFAYSKYAKVPVSSGITGMQAARQLLDSQDLYQVGINQVAGTLSDHYDPANKVVNLSAGNYTDASIAAVAVACHECGHALQDKEGYAFMRIRAALIPAVNFSSYAGYLAIMVGVFFGLTNIIWLGILLEMVILLFQVITLPVEVDASSRALKQMQLSGYFSDEELKDSKTVLTAAALTYVAGVATTLLEIMRLILLYGRRNNRD